MQLYLNDQLMDLSDDSPIALSFQINNLAEVKNQQGNTSNQFKLPLTQRNRQILGFPDEVAFTTDLPYRQYQAKIIQDGLEIVPFGTGELNGIEQDFANVTVLSGNVDFFDAIDGKIYDMGDSTTTTGAKKLWQPYDHYWTLPVVAGSQQNTEGWIWPVIDYGNMVVDLAGTPVINVRHLRPGFFLKTAVELIAANAGFRATGSLLTDPLYEQLIVQFANDSFEHGTDYQTGFDLNGISVAQSTDLLVEHPNAANPDGYIHWPMINNDPSNQFILGFIYSPARIIAADITLNIPKFYFSGRVTGSHPSSLSMAIVLSDTINNVQTELATTTFDFTENFNRLSGSGGNVRGDWTFLNTKLTASADLAPGLQIVVRYSFQGDTPTSFIMYGGASLVIKSNNMAVQYGQKVQCERIFPDLSQKDLLKDTLQRFGIICQTDSVNRTINFASFRDITDRIPVARDWTVKCLDQGKAIAFQLGGYAQINYMKYKADDAVLPQTLGQSQINVDDKTLPGTAELFQSQFAATLNRTYLGGSIAQIVKVDAADDSGDFSVNTQPRILINQQLRLNGKNIRFTDGGANPDVYVNDVIATPYFDKSGGPYSLFFENLRLQYYPELEKILARSKKVVRYFMLTPRDILELDLLIPVYLQQDGCYYYINKIDSWRKGQPTKVELVKLG